MRREPFATRMMVTQLRAMLARAVAGGGTVAEEVFTDCGHSPHLERPEQFGELLARFVNANP